MRDKLWYIVCLLIFGIWFWFPNKPESLPGQIISRPEPLPITGALNDAVFDSEHRIIKAIGPDPFFFPNLSSILINTSNVRLKTPLSAMRMKVKSLNKFNENDFVIFYVPSDVLLRKEISEKYKSVGKPVYRDGKTDVIWQFPYPAIKVRIDIPSDAIMELEEIEYYPAKVPLLNNKIRRILSIILFIAALALLFFLYLWGMPLHVVERRVLGLSSLTILMFWSFVTYADSGTFEEHGVRLFIICFVCGIVIIEFLKPWWGLYLFLLIWPFMSVFREILIMWGGFVWSAFPEISSGIITVTSPMAAALSIGCWLRIERDLSGQIIDYKRIPKNIWIEILRIAFWVIIISYIISCLLAAFKLRTPPSDWVTVPSSWNSLLLTDPYSTFAPIWNSINTLPSLILGLLLIRYLKIQSYLSNKAQVFSLPSFPIKQMTAICAVAGIIMGGHVLFQIVTNIQWPFNGAPPSGPFENRDLVSPALIIFGMICIQVATERRIIRAGFIIAGFSLIGISLLTSCRNALFMVLLIPLLMLLIHANRRKIALVFSLLMIMLLMIYIMPLKQLGKFPSPTIQRTVDTLKVIRTSGLVAGLDARSPIYSTAIKIWQDYPLTGAGPSSFVMLTHSQARYGAISRNIGQNLCHAHNIPLQLLSEVGPLASLAWIVLWIIWPLLALMFWQQDNLKALTVLMIGAGSQFEFFWRVPGMSVFSVLLIIWAVAESSHINIKGAPK